MFTGELLDTLRMDPILARRLGHVSLRGSGLPDRPEGPPFADAQDVLDAPGGGPLPGRAQYFSSRASFRISLSREIGDELLQPGILLLQFLELVPVHRTILALLAIVGLLGDADVTDCVRDRAPSTLRSFVII